MLKENQKKYWIKAFEVCATKYKSEKSIKFDFWFYIGEKYNSIGHKEFEDYIYYTFSNYEWGPRIIKDIEILINEDDYKQELIKLLKITVNKKTSYRNVYSKNKNELKKIILNIFLKNEEYAMDKIAFLKKLLIEKDFIELDKQYYGIFTKIWKNINFESKTEANYNYNEIINEIKKECRSKIYEIDYYIVSNYGTGDSDEGSDKRALYKLTRNKNEILKYCTSSASKGCLQTLSNLRYLSNKNLIKDITTDIDTIIEVLNNLGNYK